MYGPDMTILLMYGSHDMRHIGFSHVDGGQRNPREMGRHIFYIYSVGAMGFGPCLLANRPSPTKRL